MAQRGLVQQLEANMQSPGNIEGGGSLPQKQQPLRYVLQTFAPGTLFVFFQVQPRNGGQTGLRTDKQQFIHWPLWVTFQ